MLSRLDPALVAGLAGSLIFHGAAIAAVAFVRLDRAPEPLQAELVELAPPAPPVSPAGPAKPARVAAPALDRPAPALPEPSEPRREPLQTLALPAPALPEHLPASRQARQEPPELAVARAARPEPALVTAPARPERPLAELSEPRALSAANPDETALPQKVERRAALSEAGSTRKPEPSLALAEPAEPRRQIAEPTTALGQLEREPESHVAALLSTRAPDREPPAASSQSPAPPPTVGTKPADRGPGTPPRAPAAWSPPNEIPAPAAAGSSTSVSPVATPRSSPSPAPGQLLAALPPGAPQAGPIVAPRLAAPRKPRYPEAARQAGAEGTVFVKAYVLADGSVKEARVERSAGNASLDRAALQTIREARFVPAERGGRPVPVWVEIPIDFKLER